MATYRLAGDRPGTWESPLTPGMITAVRRLGSPQASPDGAWVAYTLSYDGRTDLYLVPGRGGLPRQLTTDYAVAGGNYCWTPDSRAIIYTAAGAGDGALWRISVEDGVARRLSEGNGRHIFPRVSPDGAFVALVADRDEEVDIGLAPLLPGDETTWPLRVSSGPDFTVDPQWAPDSTFLVWMAYDNRRMPWDESRIVLSRREGMPLGERRVVAEQANHAHVQPRVSPDGRRLAFLCDGTGWLNVWLKNLDGAAATSGAATSGAATSGAATSGAARPIAPEEHEHGGPAWLFDARDLAWSPDGRHIAHTRNVNGRINLALLDPASGERAMLTDLPGVHTQLSWCGPDALVCTFSAPDTPPQIVRIAVPSGARTVLAAGTPAGLAAGRAAGPAHISYPATDGRTAHGLVYTPRRPAPREGYPLLVHFHGGPTGQCVENWNGPLQYFLARGWAVFEPNFRGSTGYGKEHKDALNGLWGEGEVRDSLGGVEHLSARGGIDRGRVVAWGGSNGGYDVLYCLSKMPGAFAAGGCLYGISDLPLLSEGTHRFERYYNDTLVGPLPEAWTRQRELSPLDHAEQVRDPLLILHGAKDTDVPLNQAELFVEKLKRGGKEHEFHVYPDEGHGWSRVATTLDYLARMDTFLTRHVLMRSRA